MIFDLKKCSDIEYLKKGVSTLIETLMTIKSIHRLNFRINTLHIEVIKTSLSNYEPEFLLRLLSISYTISI